MSLIEQHALQFTHHYFGTSIEMGHSKCQLYFAKEIAPQWRKGLTVCVCVIMQMTSLFLFGQTAAEHAIGEYQYKYQFADTLQLRRADEEGMLLQKV